MTEAKVAQRGPFEVAVVAGQDYFWCQCGLSATQPFCDRSHKGTGIFPVKFHAERDEVLRFCGCKHTGTPPFCNGTHQTL